MPANATNFLIIYVIGMVVILYFLMVLPAKKKNRKMQNLHNSVSVGDQIATIGGIIGIVTEKKDDMVKILVDEKTGAEITIVLAAVHNILTPAENK